MSDSVNPMELEHARQLATRIVDRLGEGCDKIQIAGSIRRRKSTVNDIEIICIPRFWDFEACLGDMINDFVIVPVGKDGPKYKQFFIEDFRKVDLFIVTPETWGVLLAIRTGPAMFSKSLVTPMCFGGRLSDGLYVRDGRVWKSPTSTREEEAVDTPEEKDFFELCGGWMEPEEREG